MSFVSLRFVARCVAAAGFLIVGPLAGATTNWNGTYSYERTYTNASDQRAGEIYTVTIGPGKACQITITGPAAHEDIVCRAAKSEKSTTLHFRRFADVKSAEINNARPYKKDQRLLSFEMGVSEKRPNTIRTVWHELRTMDGKRPRGGVKFKRTSK